MKFDLRGVRWTLLRARKGLSKSRQFPHGLWGLCETGPKRITVRPSRDFPGVEKELDTVIHELLHAAWDSASEDRVTKVATAIAGVLVKQFDITPRNRGRKQRP
jgi:hypothetical protein